jgi:hypothetical protein
VCSPPERRIFQPVHASSAANGQATHEYVSSASAPAKMNTARRTSAMRMPYSRMRGCSSFGTARAAKMSVKTKTLSSDSAFSIT